jgi:hypothetical protein
VAVVFSSLGADMYRIECWPWQADPTAAAQFPQWPYNLPFSSA